MELASRAKGINKIFLIMLALIEVAQKYFTNYINISKDNTSAY